MSTTASIPEACSQCPYLDQFHATCTHAFRQSIIHELSDSAGECPVYADVRATAMRDLLDQLE